MLASASVFTRTDVGEPLAAGALRTNPELAETLTLISEEGADAFFRLRVLRGLLVLGCSLLLVVGLLPILQEPVSVIGLVDLLVFEDLVLFVFTEKW